MDYLKDYSYYLRIERRCSPNTVSAYCSDVQAFLNSIPKSASEYESADIGHYLAAKSKELDKRSQARVLSSLRSFFSWTVLEGWRKDNPCDAVDAPKIGRKVPSVLSVQEIDSIIDSVDLSTPAGLRDRAILEVLYGCGLRVSELCQLRVSCLYFEQGFVRIIGKGNKERIVPLGQMAADALREYLAVRPESAQAAFDDLVFLNLRGGSLSRVSVFKMVKHQALMAGVTKEISPHSFRHSFATHLIENGADLRVVQEMLGHESILTTEIYTHIDKSTWQADILEHHPRG